MVLSGWWQGELGEDAGHVLLHGTFRDHKGIGDRPVAAPLRHQRQHLALTRSELLEWVLGSAPSKNLRDALRVERRASFGHPANRFGESGPVSDPVLEQVADAGSVVPQQFE